MDLAVAGVHDSSKRQSAIPLCLPKNYQWDSRTGKCIRTGDHADGLYVVGEALEQLWKVKGPVCAVSITGDCRSGKSFFLSEAFKQPDVFPIGHDFDVVTIGIWLWIVPEKYWDASGQQLTVLLLDCESFYDNGMWEEEYSERWLDLSILLSSVLLFNIRGPPTRSHLEKLQFITKLSEIIHAKSSTKAHSARKETELFHKTFPHFTWLLRDTMARLPLDCRDTRDFFMKKVFKYDDVGNQVGEAILRFFPSFDALSLPPPTADSEVMVNLKKYRHLVYPSFLSAMEEIVSSLMCKLEANRSIVEGERITGEVLAALVQVYVDMLNTPSGIVDMRLAWEKAMHMRESMKVNESLMRTIWELQQEIHALKEKCACYNNMSRAYQGKLQSITRYSEGSEQKIRELEKTKIKLEEEIREQQKKLNCVTELDRYEMKEGRGGLCVVISNFSFPGVRKRRGAETDEKKIVDLFREELHFEMEVLQNLHGSEIIKKAKEIAARDLSQYKGLVFIIMSHGDKDAIEGVDGASVKVVQLMSQFSVKECPSLRNKPKLFFIEACRGQLSDPRVNRLPPSLGNTEGDGINNSSNSTAIMLCPDSSLAHGVTPLEADFLLSFATVPGYKAWRSQVAGSWYIQVLADVIRKYHRHHHLLDMLTEVNKRVAAIANEYPEYDLSFQVPAHSNTLRAKVFLS